MNDSRPTFGRIDWFVATERGLDLDDDHAQLRAMQEAAEANDLTVVGWRFLGVLRWRADDLEGAIDAFRCAQADDPDATAKFLQACAHIRSGDTTSATPLLDALFADELPDDVEFSMATVAHARGDAAWVSGDLEGAFAAYSAANDISEHAQTFLELARLHDVHGRSDEALECCQAAADEDPSVWQATYLTAQIRAELGELEEAVDALRDTVTWEPAAKELFADDQRLSALAGLSSFEALRAVPPPPDTSWVGAFPGLAALRDDSRLTEAGFQFVDEATSNQAGEALEEHYGGGFHLGIVWTEAVWEASVEAARGKRLLAEGPPIWNPQGYEMRPKVYFEPDDPSKLWLLPSIDIPALLATEIDATPEALLEAAQSMCRARTPRTELTSHHRALMGYFSSTWVPNPWSGELELATPHALDRHWPSSPGVADLAWGTAFPDNPWPDRIPPQPAWGIKLAGASRRMREQAPGFVARFTRRTLFSRAHIAYELHQLRLYVWDVRYVPSPYPAPIERLNAAMGQDFPTDMPVDLAAALIGFQFMRREELEADLDAQVEPGAIGAYLQVLAALRFEDPSLGDWLRPYCEHEDAHVRVVVANLCLDYGWADLLEHLGEVEPDPDMRTYIAQALSEGIEPPGFDEMGEPFGLAEVFEALYEDE